MSIYYSPGLSFTPLNPANNLSDLPDAATARTNLGAVAASSIGAANGVAGLNSSSKVPDSQLSHPIVALTQSAYDALSTKDANTLYVITS